MSALLPEPEAVVFDFDGTIADTRGLIVSCFRKTYGALGMEPPEETLIAGTIGLPLATAFARLSGFSSAESEQAAERYRTLFRELDVREVAPLPGMVPLLHRCAEAGIPLGVASSRGHDTLDPMLEALGVFELLGAVVDTADAGEEKPNPQMLLLAAEKLGVKPSRVVMIGDTSFDIEMGRNAGAWTIAVTWGNHSREELEAAKPTILAARAEEIASALGLVTAL